MALEYIFPDHSKRNHQIAIWVEVVAAVVALVLMFWAASHYWISPKVPVVVEPVKNIDPVAEKIGLIDQSPPMEPSPMEVAQKKSMLELTAKTVKLTPEQIQAKRSLIENI